ncbi:MAG: fibronectin type III domain-containing protein [Blautia sp.]|jgi:hypothetical protein
MKKKNTWKKLLGACLLALMLTGIWSVSALASGFEEAEASEAMLGATAVLKQTNATTTSVTISWDRVEGASSYTLSLSEYSPVNYSVETEITATKDKESYTIKNLKAGLKYWVKVQTDNYKTSSIVCKTIPGTVKNVKQYCYPSSKRMNFSWDRIQSADGYEIYKYSTGNKYLSRYDAKSSTSKTIGMGSNFYSFRIRAYTYINGVKKNGRLYRFYTSLQPSMDRYYRTGTTTVRVPWAKISGATNYEVYLSTKKDSGYKKVKTVTTNQATLSNVKSGQLYYIYVRATKKIDGKTWKSPATYTYKIS